MSDLPAWYADEMPNPFQYEERTFELHSKGLTVPDIIKHLRKEWEAYNPDEQLIEYMCDLFDNLNGVRCFDIAVPTQYGIIKAHLYNNEIITETIVYERLVF